MDKDQRLVESIKKIQRSINSELLEVIDHWESDLCAIGIRNRNHENELIYISNFNKSEDFFYYEYEITKDDGDFETIEKSENTSFDELIQILKQKLKFNN